MPNVKGSIRKTAAKLALTGALDAKPGRYANRRNEPTPTAPPGSNWKSHLSHHGRRISKRKSRKGRSVNIAVDSWWDPDDRAIRLTTNHPDPAAQSFHVAVRQDPNQSSGQPYLFRELAKCLRSQEAPPRLSDQRI
jgi:hypothetical protein